MTPDPQNPYRSCVVRASAGSGKTYQLSWRFLFLVGSGAHPSTIMTVTFTKKAAGEMRERILDTAAHLLSDPLAQEAFDRKLRKFYTETDHILVKPCPPRSAIATAEAVLSSTQSLRIATIDAVLLEWMRKFPYEAGDQGALPIPSSFEMMSHRDEERLHRKAWFHTVQAVLEDPQLSQRWAAMRLQGLNLLDLEHRVRELSKHESFLWLLQKRYDTEPGPLLLPHPVPAETWDDSPEEFLRVMQDQLDSICDMLAKPKAEHARAALRALDIGMLLELRVLTKDWQIHNGTFRRPKRDPFEAAIFSVNEQAKAIRSYKVRSQLNELGDFMLRLYSLYEQQQSRWKLDMGRLAFGDLIKGGYHLFNRAEAAGVRFLLHRTIRHLLLDEFQDTSILQWSMFSSMATEMLAGEGLRGPDEVPSSLFIVGDAKQSIYGFREADAEVLQEAARFMVSREAWDISLSASYRTAPTLLSYINQVFKNHIPEFPTHATAQKPDGEPVVRGLASFTIGPLFAEDQHPDPIGEEARFVASSLRRTIADPNTSPLWDKEKECYRRLEAGDCAILYRAATHATVYAEALRSEGMAVRMEEGHSFFERLEIRDLMAFCRWMCLPSHTEAFVHTLKSPLFRMQDSAILTALFQVSGQQISRYERHLGVLDHLSGIYPEAVARLHQILSQRSVLRPQTLLREAAHHGSWNAAYRHCFGDEEGALAAANLSRFLETITNLESQGFYDWMPLVQKLEELAAEKSISLASVSENAVQLMTVHKAKGLEFPLVVVVGTGEEWEKTDPYWAKIKESPVGSGMAYVGRRIDRPSEDAHFEKLSSILHAEAYQENLRLLYVALTRAQYHLFITGHHRKKRGFGFYEILKSSAIACGAMEKEWENGLVFHATDAGEISDMQIVEKAAVQSAPDEPLSALRSWFAPRARTPAIKILAPARLLDGYESSEHFGPSAHPFATEIGTFIHRGLEAFIKEKEFPAEDSWRSLVGHHETESFAKAFQHALRRLEAVRASRPFLNLLNEAISKEAELPIAFLHGDQLVRGSIDLLLQFRSDHWVVIDYKTSEEALYREDLHALAIEKRYDQQLALYVQGVCLLYPSARVEGAILFTEREELIALQTFLCAADTRARNHISG